MQAVIMAGGKGTRLYPYSALFPKPLMPLGDMPILELLLRRLKNAGVTDVILAVNHLSHLIEAFFGDGSKLGLKIRYSHEDRALGTAGGLGAIVDDLEDTFLVTNGDLLTTLDIEQMIESHRSRNADASIGVFEREYKIDFGLIERDADDRLLGYREKPTSKFFVSMGVYVLQREAVRAHLKSGEYLDMPTLLIKMKEAFSDVRCFHKECIWLDIGRPDDFARAQEMFEKDRNLFLGDLVNAPGAQPNYSAPVVPMTPAPVGSLTAAPVASPAPAPVISLTVAPVTTPASTPVAPSTTAPPTRVVAEAEAR